MIRKSDAGVRAALEVLREDPTRGKLLQMSFKGLRSWRTGDYRIVYRVVASFQPFATKTASFVPEDAVAEKSE